MDMKLRAWQRENSLPLSGTPREAAHEFAERAVKDNPQLGWAGTAALQLKTLAGDWDGALAMLDGQRTAGVLPKPEIQRKRAVLQTARAMALLDSNPTEARNAATAAAKLAPDLVPAAVTAAEAMVRLGDVRKAASLLEKAWKKQPHPDIANAYMHVRAGDSVHDRLKRAEKLLALRSNNPESQMAVAQAALAAGEYRQAREALEAAIRTGPRESAWLLLADVEEAETGDQGRVRAWLAKAVRAPRDPAWTADGYVSERWLPASPVTGEIDAFQWKVPVEQIGPTLEGGKDAPVPKPVDPADLAIPIMPPAPVAVPEAKAAPEPEPEPESEPAETEAAIEPAAEETVIEAEVVAEEAKAPEPETAEAVETAAEAEVPQEAGTEAEAPAGEDRAGDEAAVLTRMPDDPGPEAAEEEEKPRRFRLF